MIVPLVILGAVASTTSVPVGHAQDGKPITACGQVVKTNAFLVRDLTCSGRPGVGIGASEITIDLNGFALRGDHSSGRYGVDDMGGFHGVTAVNGVLRNFDYGVVGFGANRLRLGEETRAAQLATTQSETPGNS